MKAKDLKNSILQLAIQGKLVPQDPKDEPASKLLEKIRAAKQKLVKEGKIKKDKQESFIYKGDDNNYYEKIGKEVRNITDEIPFEIPDSWAWIRLGDVMEIARGGSPRPIQNFLTDDPNGINWIKIGDTSKTGKYINSTKEKIIPEGMKKSRFVHKGDFLLTNSMSFGRPYILNIDGCIHDGWLVISNIYQLYSMDYLYYLLSSPFAHSQFSGKVSGAVVKNLNSNKVADSLFPLPPLSEQKRIVRRIEFLEPYVEEYDKAETELSVLNETFPEQIKKSILQYAIQGKLVPQDPNDEPASVLLEKIKAEKQKLIKAGKIKKDKVESYIYKRDNRHYEKIGNKEVDITDEIPFKIPDNWEWVRLERVSFVTKLAGFEYTKYIANNLTSDGIPLFKGKNIQDGKIIYSFESYIPKETSDFLIRSQINGKCILTPYVGTIGNIAIHNREGRFHLGSNVGKIELFNNFSQNLLEEYVLFYLKSDFGYKELTKHKKATAQESISIDAIRDVLLPIPPLNEQNRIVAKIDELLRLLPSCN